MSRDTANGVLGRTPFTPGMVRQVAMPPVARARSTLSDVDYEDAFLADTGQARDPTGEQWARAVPAPTTTAGVLDRR